MASLENRTGTFNVVFRFGGKKFTRSLGTKKRREANARLTRLEENIRLVESGRMTIPDDADVATFLLSDGRITHKADLAQRVTLKELFDAYFASLPKGNLEATTMRTLATHARHFKRHLKQSRSVSEITLKLLQSYVTKRLKEPGARGRTVSPVTIKKEIASLRAVWNWGVLQGLVEGVFPSRGLRYPKVEEAPPFQTWQQIEKRIAAGGLTDAEEQDLWACLFLSRDEVDELLGFVESAAKLPTIYPMVVAAAHTGARRSELVRSKLTDIEGDELILRERKRDSSRHTTRRVPLSTRLRQALDDWLEIHPGGEFTFCIDGAVKHGGKPRKRPEPLTPDEAHDLLRRTLQGSRWEKIKGWHCLRHSFISNLARERVDQRLIDSYVGHTTDAMRRRYTHLFPDSRQAAIREVFG